VRSAGCRVAALMLAALRGELTMASDVIMVVAWPAFRMMCILIGNDVSLVVSSANAATPGCRMACADVYRWQCFLKGAYSCCTTSAWWWDGLPPVCCAFWLQMACLGSCKAPLHQSLAAGLIALGVCRRPRCYEVRSAAEQHHHGGGTVCHQCAVDSDC
jgi:hypothetical protein